MTIKTYAPAALCTLTAALALTLNAPVMAAVSPTSEARNQEQAQMIAPIGSYQVAGNEDRSTYSASASSISPAATQAITTPIGDGNADCRQVGPQYEVWCVAAALRQASKKAGTRGDYGDAGKIMQEAARKLEQLGRANVDRRAPRKRGKNGTYRAIKADKVAAVNRQARAIVQEAETKLLRSSGSGARKTHYQQIAKAVGSTKVILRS